MDLDTLLEKHGLPTYGSDEVKKERLKRNNLWPWDAPKKPSEYVAVSYKVSNNPTIATLGEWENFKSNPSEGEVTLSQEVFDKIEAEIKKLPAPIFDKPTKYVVTANKPDPLDAALDALKTPLNEAYKAAFPSAKKLGRPAKVK